MWEKFKVQMPLYDEDDIEIGNDTDTDTDTDDDKKDDLDILTGDEEDKEEDEEVKEDDEDKDEEDDKDDDDEEDEDEVKELSKVTYSELKKEFPELFKKKPELKAQLFLGQELINRFATPIEADKAIEDQGRYEDLKALVLSGDAGTLLKNIKSVSEDSLEEFSEKFLPSLEKVDEKLYTRITTPILRNMISAVHNEGKRSGNENLVKAAILFNRAYFSNDDIRAGEFKSDKKDDKLDREKHEFYEGKRIELGSSIAKECERKLIQAIEDGLDPTKVLEKRPNTKARMIKNILNEVRDLLADDEGHMRIMESLWEREKRAGYSGRLKGSFINAYLSRAKAHVPKIRRQVRADILGRTKSDDIEKRNKASQNRSEPDSRSENRGGAKVISVAEAKKDKLSEKDILMGRKTG